MSIQLSTLRDDWTRCSSTVRVHISYPKSGIDSIAPLLYQGISRLISRLMLIDRYNSLRESTQPGYTIPSGRAIMQQTHGTLQARASTVEH